MADNRILIVGGTGFVGRNLARKALNLRYNVSVVSLHEPEQENIEQGVSYYPVNIGDYDSLKETLKHISPDYVVNLGGYVDHSNFFSGGDDVINTHLKGVMNLARALNWEQVKGFVQVGSSDEYGGNPAPQSEEIKECPFSSYSFAKTAASYFLQMLHRENNLPVSMVRLFLVYGPGQNRQRFIPQIIQGCLKGDTFPTSLGEQKRDFCYIDDVADGIISILGNPRTFGQVINLASGNPTSIKDLIEFIRTCVGSGTPEYGKLAYREGENMALYADISKAEQLISWHPAVSLEPGILKTIEFYKGTLT